MKSRWAMRWAVAAGVVAVFGVVGCTTEDSEDKGANNYGEDVTAEMDLSSSDTTGNRHTDGGHDVSEDYGYVAMDAMCAADTSGIDPGLALGEMDEDGNPVNYQDGEQYGEYVENEFIETSEEAVSTFSVDVDTGSYTIMRRDLNNGVLPVEDSVRVEEYLNYFRYEYPRPEDHPFSVTMEMAPSLFGDGLHLLRIGLMGDVIPVEERIPANLVFLIDVSGSMSHGDNKLPLVKFMLKQLVNVLRPSDTLGIVVYAGTDAVLLNPTPVNDKSAIIDGIDALSAGGSTAGAAGITTAYQLAAANMMEGGINRVILCTDGDFNVGLTGDSLIEMIEDYRDTGVSLSVFAFGTGNLNDQYMEQLADHGNGNYAYVDSQNEALHIIGDKLVSTLQIIAKDVKVQVEFNPANVLRYRLVGYENRLLNNEDFNDDTVDAAEIGAGHNVTAFYEVELADSLSADRISQCRFRYKQPDGDTSILITQDVFAEDTLDTFEEASADFRFAAAVVEYAEILRHSMHSEGAQFDVVASVASDSVNVDHPEALEFLDLVDIASGLWNQ